jgi:3-deoxy-D-manno-octulosonic-acid transferase
MRIFYHLFVHVYNLLAWVSSSFNPKAKKWIQGRRNIFKRLEHEIKDGDKIIWFHCASLGEFEQGRPVIEAVQSTFSDHKILLTFFSPSGYEIRKDYEGADYIFYLPADTAKNARKFIYITRPRLVFFIKYEFWFNYFDELYKNKIPLFVVSAIFRRSQFFFRPAGGWMRRQLQKVTYFFVQNQKSLALLRMIKVYHADLSGDTRFDRVLKLSREKVTYPLIANFGNNEPLLVAGSTWPADEDVLLGLLEQSDHSFKLVIAPHELNNGHVSQLLKKFKKYKPVLYSEYNEVKNINSRVMIVDTYGMLAYLFRYAKLAYIGGGFGTGIHNTLEAATYAIPVLFGPNYLRFQEAVDLIDCGGAHSITNVEECLTVFDLLMHNNEEYKKCADAAGVYVRQNAGATSLVVDKAKEFLLAE